MRGRIVFRTDRYEGSQYKRSPYYVGAKLLDALSAEDISLPDVFSFKNKLKKSNRMDIDVF